MSPLKKISPLIVAALAVMVSCRDYGEPGGVENNLQLNFVTYAGSDGQGSRYVYQAYDDSPAVDLYARGIVIDTATHVGTRMMLQYYETGSTTDGMQDINVTARVSTFSDSLRMVTQQSYDKLNSATVRLTSMWRAGEYINVNMQVQYSDSTRILALVVPPVVQNATAKAVDAYLIDDLRGQKGYFYRRAYASFSTSKFWQEHPACDTLRVYINDERFPDVKYYSFTRPKNN